MYRSTAVQRKARLCALRTESVGQKEVKMVSARHTIKPLALVVAFQLFILFVLNIGYVQADGEELFLGKIKKMAADSLVVEVMRNNPDGRTVGEKMTLLTGEHTKIMDTSRNVISFKRLSVDSVVWIRPHTLPNNDVEAVVIYLVGR